MAFLALTFATIAAFCWWCGSRYVVLARELQETRHDFDVLKGSVDAAIFAAIRPVDDEVKKEG